MNAWLYALLLALVPVFSTAPAYALSDSATHGVLEKTPEKGEFGDFALGGGVMLESDESSIKLLVAAQYGGYERRSGGSVVTRYFSVSVQVQFETAPGAKQPDAFIVNVVPVTREEAIGENAKLGRRYFPLEVRSDAGLRLRSSVAVQTLGWSYEFESDGGAPAIGKMMTFAQVIVDVLGLRIAALGDGESFTGLQGAIAQGKAGIGWRLSEPVSFRISLNGIQNTTLGGFGSTTHGGVMVESDIWARLELAIKTTVVKLTAAIDAGFHSYHLFEIGHDERFARDHFYLIFSLGGAF